MDQKDSELAKLSVWVDALARDVLHAFVLLGRHLGSLAHIRPAHVFIRYFSKVEHATLGQSGITFALDGFEWCFDFKARGYDSMCVILSTNDSHRFGTTRGVQCGEIESKASETQSFFQILDTMSRSAAGAGSSPSSAATRTDPAVVLSVQNIIISNQNQQRPLPAAVWRIGDVICDPNNAVPITHIGHWHLNNNNVSEHVNIVPFTYLWCDVYLRDLLKTLSATASGEGVVQGTNPHDCAGNGLHWTPLITSASSAKSHGGGDALRILIPASQLLDDSVKNGGLRIYGTRVFGRELRHTAITGVRAADTVFTPKGWADPAPQLVLSASDSIIKRRDGFPGEYGWLCTRTDTGTGYHDVMDVCSVSPQAISAAKGARFAFKDASSHGLIGSCHLFIEWMQALKDPTRAWDTLYPFFEVDDRKVIDVAMGCFSSISSSSSNLPARRKRVLPIEVKLPSATPTSKLTASQLQWLINPDGTVDDKLNIRKYKGEETITAYVKYTTNEAARAARAATTPSMDPGSVVHQRAAYGDDAGYSLVQVTRPQLKNLALHPDVEVFGGLTKIVPA